MSWLFIAILVVACILLGPQLYATLTKPTTAPATPPATPPAAPPASAGGSTGTGTNSTGNTTGGGSTVPIVPVVPVTPSPTIVRADGSMVSPGGKIYNIKPNYDYIFGDLAYNPSEWTSAPKMCDETPSCIAFVTQNDNPDKGKGFWLKYALNASNKGPTPNRSTYLINGMNFP